MTAADARAAAVVRLLSPAQQQALRDAGNSRLVQDSRGIVRGTAGTMQPATIDVLLGRGGRLAAELREQPLIRLDGQPGSALRLWRPTDLGGAVLARLAGQDGDRS